jgi:Tol biopolymer transport system component
MNIKTSQKVCLILLLAFIIGASKNAIADFTLGTPTNLGSTVNSLSGDYGCSITADGLSLFFSSDRPGGYGGSDLWVTTRETIQDEWTSPINLGPTVNRSGWEGTTSIAPDGLELYFNYTGIWVTTRATTSEPWGQPMRLGSEVNSGAGEVNPSISADGLSLFFGVSSKRDGGSGGIDIWVTSRATLDHSWGTAVNPGPPINSPDGDWGASLSSDGRTLFFGSDRPGGYGDMDTWITTRASISDSWGPAVNLGPIINGSSRDILPCLSRDGSTLYFTSDRTGGVGSSDLWQVSISSIVDLNADGIVDSADMCIVVDHWGTDDPLCDIGPMPWGDGIVDVEDLKVLAEHLFEEVSDPTLLAHWTLDETEGMFATDSVGNNDAVVVGGAEWQPTSGYVDGALQLNGVDSCAITNPVLNPGDGSFSFFAWIKGGVPEQVIASQQVISNWLAVDVEGNLMTELKSSDQLAGPLLSETVITDGQWHRIGLVWDGTHRKLCVDGLEVAEDTQPGLEGSQMGLYLGVDKNYAPGTFFSGLIDDIRIYNRVVSP